ncbi:nematocyst expressed protein 3-like [Schistocerca nitens]|uniref:nematocyst expressed protein 3-like n=1 Tax=Schistocerca nitens TaxID=7011 RepID=UPI002118A34E|nr:nematocyst expressed protein 3-like [Schistocerca nitens]
MSEREDASTAKGVADRRPAKPALSTAPSGPPATTALAMNMDTEMDYVSDALQVPLPDSDDESTARTDVPAAARTAKRRATTAPGTTRAPPNGKKAKQTDVAVDDEGFQLVKRPASFQRAAARSRRQRPGSIKRPAPVRPGVSFAAATTSGSSPQASVPAPKPATVAPAPATETDRRPRAMVRPSAQRSAQQQGEDQGHHDHSQQGRQADVVPTPAQHSRAAPVPSPAADSSMAEMKLLLQELRELLKDIPRQLIAAVSAAVQALFTGPLASQHGP